MEEEPRRNGSPPGSFRMVCTGGVEDGGRQEEGVRPGTEGAVLNGRPGAEEKGLDVKHVQSGPCCYRCRVEFKLRNFSFSHPHPDLFYTSQWRWPPIVFILYRLVTAGYVLSWLVYTAVTFPTTIRPWPVWLTNWSYLLLTCHLVLACVISVLHHGASGQHCCQRSQRAISRERRDTPRGFNSTSGILAESSDGGNATDSSDFTVTFDNLEDALPWYIKLDWFLFAIVSNISFIVTIVYFVALFPQLMNIDAAPPLLEDLHLHLVNSLVILLELALTAIPIRLLHVLYPFIYGLVYIIFSAVYWAVDHKNVLYPHVLDWNEPGQTMVVVVILAFVFVPFFQFITFGLYHLRLCLDRYLSAQNR